MRIAMVANWWYRRGGLGAVMLDEAAELERRGYEIIPFAARHPENLATSWASYFPEFRETADLGAAMTPAGRVSTALRLLHNSEAVACFARLLDDTHPDVIHLHNSVRQLSPGILAVAQRRRIPVVMTQHNYGLVCPQGLLLKGEREACTPPNCTRGNSLPAVARRCVRRRLVPSAVAAVEYGLHRARGSYAARVQLLLAPSHFIAKVLVDAGLPAGKVRHLANGIDPGGEPPTLPAAGGHILYAGRLVREKGLLVLIEAARRLPAISVVVAGDGPEREVLQLSAPPSVRFVGHRTKDELKQLRAESVAIVSPSIWYENGPISVLEAMRDGRPSIVTDIGGQAELVAERGGLVVPPRDPGALAEAMSQLWDDRNTAAVIGRAGRERLLASFTLAEHVSRLEALYDEVRAPDAH